MLCEFTAAHLGPAAPACLALVGLAALGAWYRRARGTTLVAPLCWSGVALLATAAVEVATAAAPQSSAHWQAPLRYAAAVSSFCPVMALLGAKRPQDRAWQMVVVTLWIVLALPAAEWLLFTSGVPQELHPARYALLAILAAVEVGNYLPTRFAPAALLVVAGQGALLCPFASLGELRLPSACAATAALGLVDLALLAVLVARLVRRPAGSPLERIWTDFRDAYGALWALRVRERANTAAERYGWLKLSWKGPPTATGPSGENLPGESLSPEARDAALQHLAQVLWRFVSPEWIARRVDGS